MNDKYLQMISSSTMKILRDYYPFTKKALLELETRERIRALAALADMRDVFDHLNRAIRLAVSDKIEAGPQKEKLVYAEIVSANEHLRRATLEPLETALEDLLAKIIGKAKYNYIFLFLRISKVSNDEITKTLENARKTLLEVRMAKGEMDELERVALLMEKEQEKLRSLDSRLPTKITTKVIFGSIAFFLLGVLVGISVI